MTDSNLNICDGANDILWQNQIHSDKCGNDTGGCYIILQNDGNWVLYNVISGTSEPYYWTSTMDYNGDPAAGHLVILPNVTPYIQTHDQQPAMRGWSGNGILQPIDEDGHYVGDEIADI